VCVRVCVCVLVELGLQLRALCLAALL
jgi:hypothetical protein